MGTLIAHSGARKVPIEVLQALPVPESLGPRHRPTAHYDLVRSVQDEAANRKLEIAKAEYAITAEGARLFALFTFKHGGLEGAGWSFGVRNSTDQGIAARGVGGLNVFVCDNMALSGDEFLFAHKNTSGLVGRLASVVRGAFDKYLPRMEQFEQRVKELSAQVISDNAARVAIYKAFVEHKVAALRLMPAVDEAYFKHGIEVPVLEAGGGGSDVQQDERYPEMTKTTWGVHNAFTRVFKTIESPMAQQSSTRLLGKVFGL